MATGGKRGGGAFLTPLGGWAVTLFRDWQQQVEQSATMLLPRLMERSASSGVHVSAAVSLEEVLGRLLNDYAALQPEVRVRVVFGASDELTEHLLGGAPADLFLSADPQQFERLATAGLLYSGQPTPFAENGLAAIGCAGVDLAVHRPADLTGKAIKRIALARPECPLGGYTRAYLEGVQLYQPLLGRAVLVDNSRSAVTSVRAGQADVALVYSSDAVHAEGCQTLFRARRLPVPIRYAAAVLRRVGDPAPALALLTFLTSTDAARRFRQCGFQPVG
jgi:molybdate transport system substrate-binding protein